MRLPLSPRTPQGQNEQNRISFFVCSNQKVSLERANAPLVRDGSNGHEVFPASTSELEKDVNVTGTFVLEFDYVTLTCSLHVLVLQI